MNIKNIILVLLFNSVIFSENEDNAIYLLYPGPNLISFPLLTEDKNIDEFFYPIQDNLISVISQGEIGFLNNEQWVGGLNTINNLSGYWVIVDDISLLDVQGSYGNGSLYFLNAGANLISYPHNTNQSIANAIPSFMYENLFAIIGENEAALFTDSGIFGSLTQFEANKAYWFFMVNPNPFTYNNPSQFTSNINNSNILDDEINLDYSQSTAQSIFFVESAFLNGYNIAPNSQINAYCNDNQVGGKKWIGEMTDIIAMGNDGYGYTENYCQDSNSVSIQIIDDESTHDMFIIGNKDWINNNISIISLSNFQLGDLNFDNNLNITDLVILVEHIIATNVLYNEHKLLLSDSNLDNLINITDLIINLELILD